MCFTVTGKCSAAFCSSSWMSAPKLNTWRESDWIFSQASWPWCVFSDHLKIWHTHTHSMLRLSLEKQPLGSLLFSRGLVIQCGFQEHYFLLVMAIMWNMIQDSYTLPRLLMFMQNHHTDGFTLWASLNISCVNVVRDVDLQRAHCLLTFCCCCLHTIHQRSWL